MSSECPLQDVVVAEDLKNPRQSPNSIRVSLADQVPDALEIALHVRWNAFWPQRVWQVGLRKLFLPGLHNRKNQFICSAELVVYFENDKVLAACGSQIGCDIIWPDCCWEVVLHPAFGSGEFPLLLACKIHLGYTRRLVDFRTKILGF